MVFFTFAEVSIVWVLGVSEIPKCCGGPWVVICGHILEISSR